MRVSLLMRTFLAAAIVVAGSSIAFAQQDIVSYGGAAVDLTAFDDLYDGSLGSMACVAVDNSAGTVVDITGVTVDMEMSHTWIGDLTIKLQSPATTVTTLMSRTGFAEAADDGMGCCGDSSDLDGVVINFANGNPFDAETMGGTILGTEFVCTTDGECDFFPNPDLGPGTDLADFNTESAVGIWNFCVGDSAGGDNGFLNDVTLTIDGNIPVELVAFSAQTNGTAVSLNWETASETNNAGFEVQMQNGEDWDVLSFVEGNGTTTEAQTYSYNAGDMAVGTHAFRLKQIDFDGAFEYSDEVEATIETPGSHLISSAYPNPFNPQSQFTLAVAQEQQVTAELFNTLGQRVAVLFQGTVEANQAQQLTIDGAGLASGMYVVRVNGERFADAFSVTLLK